MDKRICENCLNNCIGEELKIVIKKSNNDNFSDIKITKCINFESKSLIEGSYLLF